MPIHPLCQCVFAARTNEQQMNLAAKLKDRIDYVRNFWGGYRINCCLLVGMVIKKTATWLLMFLDAQNTHMP